MFLRRQTQYVFQYEKKTFSNATSSSYQTNLPWTLLSEVDCCVRIGNLRILRFIQLLWDQQKVNFLGSCDHPSLSLLYPKNCQKRCSFLSVCKNFNLCKIRKNVWKLTVIQTFNVQHKFVQNCCWPSLLFCGFVFLQDELIIFLRSHETLPTSSKYFYLPAQNLVKRKTFCFKNS